MSMPMMNVWPVRMSMFHGFMRVLMSMPERVRFPLVGMIMMPIIVTMGMVMFHRLMGMFVIVLIPE
jgi:hypothetical protein